MGFAAYSTEMTELARDPKQIGNLVRPPPKKPGQMELGRKAGLRQETISLIENGNPATKIETLLAILSALGLELRIVPRSTEWTEQLEDLLSAP